jgi:hypothetical protein
MCFFFIGRKKLNILVYLFERFDWWKPVWSPRGKGRIIRLDVAWLAVTNLTIKKTVITPLLISQQYNLDREGWKEGSWELEGPRTCRHARHAEPLLFLLFFPFAGQRETHLIVIFVIVLLRFTCPSMGSGRGETRRVPVDASDVYVTGVSNRVDCSVADDVSNNK